MTSMASKRPEPVIRSDQWLVKICDAIGVDPGRVNRLVIDAEADEPMKIYITFYGGTELLGVEPPTPDFAAIITSREDVVKNNALEVAAELVHEQRLGAFFANEGDESQDRFVRLQNNILDLRNK